MRLDVPLQAGCAERRLPTGPTKGKKSFRQDDLFDADDHPSREHAGDRLLRCSDEELMCMVKETHDNAAFALLEHRHDRPLHAYLFQRLHNLHASQDVYQNTWVKVFTKADLFAHDRKFQPWLYSIGTNAATDWQRRNKRDRQTMSLCQERGTSEGELLTLMDLVVDDLAAPPDLLSMEEERQRVRAIIENLPAAQRNVFLLIRYEGRKFHEAAAALAIPVGTAKSRYHKAVELLGRELGVELPVKEDDQ